MTHLSFKKKIPKKQTRTEELKTSHLLRKICGVENSKKNCAWYSSDLLFPIGVTQHGITEAKYKEELPFL